MFYTHFLLAKKGPLAKVWLAAHWDKKLTKAHIFDTDLKLSVDAIIHPKVKLALRTSGHLLVGVVKIYSRKLNYLLGDCNEAMMRIKMSFRPNIMESSLEAATLAPSLLILAENIPYHLHALEYADPLSDYQASERMAELQTRNEEISMIEDMPLFSFPEEEEEEEEDDFLKLPSKNATLVDEHNMSYLESLGNILAATPKQKTIEEIPDRRENMSVQLFNNTIQSIREPSHTDHAFEENNNENVFNDNTPIDDTTNETRDVIDATATMDLAPLVLKPFDQSFMVKGVKMKKKARHLIVDNIKSLSSALMRKHSKDTSDLLTKFQLAPPTHSMMFLKEKNACSSLFCDIPRKDVFSNKLINFHKQNLITQAEDQLEDEEDMIKRNRIDGIRKSPARVEEANEVEVSVLKDGSSRGTPNPKNQFTSLISAETASFRSIEVARDDQGEARSPIVDVSRKNASNTKDLLPLERIENSMSIQDASIHAVENITDLDLNQDLFESSETRLKRKADDESPFPMRKKVSRKDKSRRSILKELQLASLSQMEKQTTPAKKSRLQQLRQQMLQQQFIFDRHEQLFLPPIPLSFPRDLVLPSPFASSANLSVESSQTSKAEEEVVSKTKTIDELETLLHSLTKSRGFSDENIDPELGTNKIITFKQLISAHSKEKNVQLNRKFVAKSFSCILEMKKQLKINLKQNIPMGDIYISLSA